MIIHGGFSANVSMLSRIKMAASLNANRLDQYTYDYIYFKIKFSASVYYREVFNVQFMCEGDFEDGVLYKEVFNTLFVIQRLHYV